MINWLSSWASQIVASIIVCTILEMILPNSNNKKYIRTVIGIYILFVIISPVVKQTDKVDIQNILNVDKYINEQTIQTAKIDTDTSIENMYKTNLKTDIKNKLKEKGYEVINITVEIELKDEQNYGRIYGMNLIVRKISKETVNNIKIEEVNIQVGNTMVTEEKEELTSVEKKEIIEYLSNTYDLKKDKIQI